jgi:hypothetical protein
MSLWMFGWGFLLACIVDLAELSFRWYFGKLPSCNRLVASLAAATLLRAVVGGAVGMAAAEAPSSTWASIVASILASGALLQLIKPHVSLFLMDRVLDCLLHLFAAMHDKNSKLTRWIRLMLRSWWGALR